MMKMTEQTVTMMCPLRSQTVNQSVRRRHLYNIELVREREIKKFKVKVSDYKVRVGSFDGDAPFDEMVQGLHGVIEGGYFISLCVMVQNVSYWLILITPQESIRLKQITLSLYRYSPRPLCQCAATRQVATHHQSPYDEPQNLATIHDPGPAHRRQSHGGGGACHPVQ